MTDGDTDFTERPQERAHRTTRRVLFCVSSIASRRPDPTTGEGRSRARRVARRCVASCRVFSDLLRSVRCTVPPTAGAARVQRSSQHSGRSIRPAPRDRERAPRPRREPRFMFLIPIANDAKLATHAVVSMVMSEYAVQYSTSRTGTTVMEIQPDCRCRTDRITTVHSTDTRCARHTELARCKLST